jgi:hypothetical protein
MQGTRKVEGCLNCGEVREIAAHGLCFKCYRREDRAKDRDLSGTDRHNPGLRKEHKKMFRGFASVMAGLSDLCVSRSDVLAIRRSLEPYLLPISSFLALRPDDEENSSVVNSEQKSGVKFTVHTMLRNGEES